MNLETKITIYKFTPQVFTLTHKLDKSETSVVFSLFISVLGYELILSLCKFILNT